MKVINVAGFPIKFDKNNQTYRIPNDGLLHTIPDEFFYTENFQGLLRVVVPPVPVKQVIKQMESPRFDFNEPEIKEIIIEKIEEKNSKPLKGVRLKKNVRSQMKKTKLTGKKKQEVEE